MFLSECSSCAEPVSRHAKAGGGDVHVLVSDQVPIARCFVGEKEACDDTDRSKPLKNAVCNESRLVEPFVAALPYVALTIGQIHPGAHDGVREIIHPITVLESEDRIFAEIDMDFIATKPRGDFPFGQLEVGDIMTVKFFVV